MPRGGASLEALSMDTRFTATLERDDLSDDMRLIADTLGLDAARTLIRELGGSRVYITSPQRIDRRAVVRYVQTSYKEDEGGRNNLKQIARDIGITLASLYLILEAAGSTLRSKRTPSTAKVPKSSRGRGRFS
jgi:hypothetical protein